MNSDKYQKLFIIGAARSGTNILRDVLSSHSKINTWECDEINPIWKYGNTENPYDDLDRNDFNDISYNFIKKSFDKIYIEDQSIDYVLEKTCANTLRLKYIDEIFPEAKFIHIYRNPIDVINSAVRRWSAPFDLNYTLKKLKYVPKNDIPFYFVKFVKNRFFKILSSKKTLNSWGPSFHELKILVESGAPVEKICAEQWKRCFTESKSFFTDIDFKRVHHICYEDFIKEPLSSLKKVMLFLDLNLEDEKKVIDLAKTVKKQHAKKFIDPHDYQNESNLYNNFKKDLLLEGRLKWK